MCLAQGPQRSDANETRTPNYAPQIYYVNTQCELPKLIFYWAHSAFGSELDCKSRVQFIEIDHEIISKVVLLFLLFQEGLYKPPGRLGCSLSLGGGSVVVDLLFCVPPIVCGSSVLVFVLIPIALCPF